MEEDIKDALKWASFIAIGTLILDLVFHVVYTSPFETGYYFLAKYILILVSGTLLYTLYGITPYTVLAHSAVFVISFSIYYRLTEVLFSIPFGGRVPDILSVTFSEQPGLSSFLWGVVHSVAVGIPAIAVLFMSRVSNGRI